MTKLLRNFGFFSILFCSGIAQAQLGSLPKSVTHSGIEVCKPLPQILVGPVSFSGINVFDAMTKIAGGSGYQVIAMGALPTELVSAEELAGPLLSVIDLFSSSYQIDIRVNSCSVRMYAKGEAPAERTYTLIEGQPIHEQLNKWAEAEGWKFRWLHPKSWEAFSATTTKSLDVTRAIGTIIEFLRLEGKAIQLRVYEGNKVMEIDSLEITGGKG